MSKVYQHLSTSVNISNSLSNCHPIFIHFHIFIQFSFSFHGALGLPNHVLLSSGPIPPGGGTFVVPVQEQVFFHAMFMSFQCKN